MMKNDEKRMKSSPKRARNSVGDVEFGDLGLLQRAAYASRWRLLEAHEDECCRGALYAQQQVVPKGFWALKAAVFNAFRWFSEGLQLRIHMFSLFFPRFWLKKRLLFITNPREVLKAASKMQLFGAHFWLGRRKPRILAFWAVFRRGLLDFGLFLADLHLFLFSFDPFSYGSEVRWKAFRRGKPRFHRPMA